MVIGVERRKPLRRNKPLRSNSGLARSRDTENGSNGGLRRTGGPRWRSKRTEKVYRDERRPLVERLLVERPGCQRCAVKPSSEIHELLSRARGGSITDPNNCVALCHDCHHWITTNPAAATAEGWLKHSWEE